MRWNPILAAVSLIWLGLLLCNTAYKSLTPTPEPTHASTPPSIDRIRELAELTVTEMQFSKVAEGSIRGHTGGVTVIALIHGAATLAVDLEQARFLHVDQDKKHLVLALPRPSVRGVAIDHHRTRVLSCERYGLWRLAVGSALEEHALAESLVIGQDMLKDAALREDHTSRARSHAQGSLSRFVAALGWTMDIRWQD